MNKLQLLSKWTALVWLNSLVCFVFAYSIGFDNLQSVIGIILAIFTVVFIYYFIDLRLYERKKELFRKWLLFGVMIQITTQIIVPLYLGVGLLTVASIGYVFDYIGYANYDFMSPFLGAYITTFLTGLLLSFSVFVISCLVAFIELKVIPRYKRNFV